MALAIDALNFGGCHTVPEKPDSAPAGTPKAVLLDLDDTILIDAATVEPCWRSACEAYAGRLGAAGVEGALVAIRQESHRYWSDPERNRTGRLDLLAARRDVVRAAFRRVGILDDAVATGVADHYTLERERRVEPAPGAIATVEALRRKGSRLALVTNGAADKQRAKIERYGLASLFDAILIEGEVGFGKPDPRIFLIACERLRVEPCETWMVGDRVNWDIEPAHQLGLGTVWIDVRGDGASRRAVPADIVVRSLAQLGEKGFVWTRRGPSLLRQG